MSHGGRRSGAGRPKGIIDKRTKRLRDDLEAKYKYDPIKALVDFAAHSDPAIAIRARVALFEATVPKLKAIELESDSTLSTAPHRLAQDLMDEAVRS